ncbi:MULTISPECIES: DUF3465 domain-containing protein [Acinetobacter]|uniref:DUF3465 domain-containing protein n=1 Tax=Acinetobacter TaxID=469 RepID=UPI0015D27BEC|nr:MULTISPECIES: DUF3465 domain-containing protein [Acinetobacter]MCL6237255.1 DUF3465 domain-containing protein [Acinetobacter amyesii]
MANKTNLTIGGIIVALAAAYFGIDLQQKKTAQVQTTAEQNSQPQIESVQTVDVHQKGQSAEDIIAHAFKNKLSNVQVEGAGQVKAVLRDDNEGSRHQKFILTLNNGQTLLVAHNIDLAPRIDDLQKGDTVQFYGEYEYSDQGGVMHWTHHDPNGRHQDGWLKHQGKTYQ